jgi:NitT/TauT family transport system substrate-binding protein
MRTLFSLSSRAVLLGLLALSAAGVTVPDAANAQAATSSPVKIRFQLDWRFEASAIPYILAQRKGYFAQEGLDVSINVGSGASATVTRLATGTVDMGVGDMSSVIEFAANNPQLPARAVFLVYENSPAAIMTLKKTGIRRVADLKGKTIGSPVNDGARKVFPLLAAANGLAPNDVTWMSIEPAMRETMLVRGQVDAIAAYLASGLMSLEKLGVPADQIQILPYADNGVQIYGNAVLASTAFLQSHPDAVRGFLKAVARAFKDMYADRAEAVRALKAFEPLIEVPVETTRLNIFLDRQVDTPLSRRNGIGEIDPQRLQQNIDRLAPEMKLKTRPDAAGLIDMRFLPSRAERTVIAH